MADKESPWYERYIPYGLLAVVFAYMVWVRTLPYSDVVSEEGVVFSANDPWYHLRVTEYLVENYPSVPPYDPWTNFPYGSTPSSGFGGMFDQIAATVAMIVGLGDPSARQVELVVAFAPVFFGAATAIPVYFLARKITDKWVAILAPFSLALFGGQWLNRTAFANAQHQSAEAFFVAVAVLGFAVAVERTYAEKPTFAHFRDRDWSGLRKPMVGAVLAGLAFAAYVLTWPAAIYLAATLGLFVVVQMVRDHMNGRSTEYLAISMAVTFLLSSVIVLVYVLLVGVQYRFSGAGFSALQPLALAVVGFGVLFLHLVSGYLRKGEYSKTAFPAAVAGIFAVGLVVLWITGLISLLEDLIGRMFSFGALTSEGALTVAEIQPATLQNAVQDFGLLVVVAGAGVVLLLVDVVRKDSPVELAVLFWSLNMFSAYFTQARFGYYLGVAVAVLVAFGVYRVVQLADLEDMDIESVNDVKNIKGYQIIALVLVVFLFLPVNVVAVGNNPNMQPAWNTVNAGTGGEPPWQQEALPWMEDNTPDISMDYNEGWETPEGQDFDYNVDESPLEGDYGVMSWWDYGHWITQVGKRVPNANPFQEGNIVSSLFFTSQSEERSDLLVEALPSVDGGASLRRMSNEELREIIENQNDQERYEDTRYVIIDDRMAAGKFGAIGTWTDFGGFVERRGFSLPDGTERQLPGLGDRYDNTTLSRLYHDDADGMAGYRLVHETETYSLIGSIDRPTQQPRINRLITRGQYDNEEALGNVSLTDLDQFPENQMLNIGGGSFLYDFRGVASVKTFERVEGATITGQANATNASVLASVRLRTTNTNREFDYFREAETDDDGRFEVTVPYATEGDVSVEEGGTNSTVEARGPYSVFVGEDVRSIERFGQVGVVGSEEEGRGKVTETDVYMGNEVEVDVEPPDTNSEPDSDDSADGSGEGDTEDGTDSGTGTGGDGTEGGGTDGGDADDGDGQTEEGTSGDSGDGSTETEGDTGTGDTGTGGESEGTDGTGTDDGSTTNTTDSTAGE